MSQTDHLEEDHLGSSEESSGLGNRILNTSIGIIIFLAVIGGGVLTYWLCHHR